MFPNYRQLKQRTFRTLSDADYALLKVEGVLKYNNIKMLKEKIQEDIPLIESIVYNKFGLNRDVNTSFYYRIKEQFESIHLTESGLGNWPPEFTGNTYGILYRVKKKKRDSLGLIETGSFLECKRGETKVFITLLKKRMVHALVNMDMFSVFSVVSLGCRGYFCVFWI